MIMRKNCGDKQIGSVVLGVMKKSVSGEKIALR